MRISKIVLALILCSTSVVWPGCATKTDSNQAAQNQIAAVQRGNLSIDITASGNLALSHKEDLAFEMAGYVEQVSVKEGDSVKEGQVLANLNTTDDWEAQITTLERQLTTAQRKVTSAERNITTAERKVTTAERQLADAQKQLPAQVAAKQQSLIQAEINVKNAETASAKSEDVYHWPDVDSVLADIKTAQTNWQNAKDALANSQAGTPAGWQRLLDRETAKLDALRAKLDTMLAGTDPDEIAIKKMQLEMAQSNLKDAQDAIPQAQEDGQRAIDDAQIALEDARAAVEDVRTALEDAKTGVQDAQKALDKAKAASPLVKAPFDGFVTMVNVKGGDEVYKGTIAVQVADPTKFEASVLVSEKDFFQVKLGGDATVQLAAVSSLSYPAKVTYIAPTATVQQGVANYKVRVELESLQPVSQNQTALSQRPQSTAQPGQTQRPQSTSQSGQTQRPQSTQSRQTTPAPAQAIQLSEGMSVTVSIVVTQRNNVLLVPNQAISIQGSQTVVKVVKDGVTELRTIRTGISDWQNTEVTDGLAEGEQIVYPRAAAAAGGTTPTTTTPAQRQGGQQPFMPVPGGLGR